MVSSPFREKLKDGEENKWHQGIIKILFYVILMSHIYNKLEATQTRVVFNPAVAFLGAFHRKKLCSFCK